MATRCKTWTLFFTLVEARDVGAEQIDRAVFRMSFMGYHSRDVDEALDRSKARLRTERG